VAPWFIDGLRGHASGVGGTQRYAYLELDFRVDFEDRVCRISKELQVVLLHPSLAEPIRGGEHETVGVEKVARSGLKPGLEIALTDATADIFVE
jgi:hypothetical protein